MSRINKKLIPKNYQKKINLSNFLPNTLFLDKITSEDHKILNFLMIDVMIIFLLINHEKLIDIINSKLRSKSFFKFSNLSYNIKVQVVNSSAHLMFLNLLWIMNFQYSFAPAPILSGPATHQGTLSYVYTMCTRKYYVNMYVLHTPGTSSVTVQTETSLKIYFSISETVFEHGQILIKLDRIFISTNFKACKTLYRRKSLSIQKVNGEQISCLFSNLPLILSVKFACNHPSSTYSSYKKCKLENFKRILIISHELILIKSNVLIIYLQKTYKNHLDLINLIIFKYAKACKRSFFFNYIKRGTYNKQ